MVKEELFALVSSADCRITDDDFDHAELTQAEEEQLIEKMVGAGYTHGLDKYFRNEWWPPSTEE